MSRRDSREYAFKLLYQLEIQKNSYDEQKKRFIEEMEINKDEQKYFEVLVDGIYSNKNDLDKIYSKYLKNWNLERIPKVDQTILRIAVFEMFKIPDLPQNVAISEAVLLSKKYSTDEARSYINGVLGKISKSTSEEVE